MTASQITVIMPNYNDSAFLPRAIVHFLSEIESDGQLLIIDDASIDNSVEIIEEYRQRDQRIRLIKCVENGGVLSALNRGLAEAQTDWLYFGSTNDPIESGFLSAATRALKAHPQAGLFCGDGWLLRKSDGHRFPVRPMLTDMPRYIDEREFFKKLTELKRDLVLPSPSVVVRADAMRKVGGFRKEMRWHSDWFAFHVIALRHGLYYDPTPYGTFELDLESFSNKGLRNEKIKRKLIRDMLETLNSESFQDVREGFRPPYVLGCFYNMRRIVVMSSLANLRNWWILSHRLILQSVMDVTRPRLWPLLWELVSPLSGNLASVCKKFVLKIFGASMGRNLQMGKKICIDAPWNIVIGNDCRIEDHTVFKGTYAINIGNRVIIEERASIISEYMDMSITPPTMLARQVSIGSDCRIGYRSKIYPGSDISNGTHISDKSEIHPNKPL